MENLEKKDKDAEIQDEEIVDDDEIKDPDDDDKTQDEVEEWMKEGDEPDQTDKSVPLGAHIKAKRKLKGRISERDEEIEALKAKVSSLESGKSKSIELPKRPRRADFEDDDAYENAYDKYEETKEDLRLQRLQQTQTLRASQDQIAEKVEKAVDGHYAEAEELIESSGISADAFKASDQSVREAVEAIRPKQGDAIVDQFISRLGKNSSKVFFRLGRSKALLGEFIALLAGDPSGLDAATFLGQQKATLLNTKKRSSSAPDPDTQLKGDEGGGQKEKLLKRRYEDAHKKGEGQKAWNAKKDAKKLGINTSEW